MATLVLHGDEKLEDFIRYEERSDLDNIYLKDIDVIIHKVGKETIILKSPHDGDGKIYKKPKSGMLDTNIYK